jgi:L-alanine-DL-glutamate epimerase-like enolase superfamily enzyme
MRDRPREFPWPAALLPRKPIFPNEDGYVELPIGPGMGIEIDENYVTKYAG